ncbi:MAG: DUF975 family protein [Endomicrobium sp.]|nr:DUF975 family protein [Endomicrobium sp.]
MSQSAFEIQEVISLGWEAFKKNALLFIVLLLLSLVANIIISAISGVIALPAVIASILSTAVGAYFMLSTARACSAASEGQSPSWEVLKNDWKPFGKFFIIFILLSLIFIISAILLLIPFLFALALFLCVPYIFAANPEIGILEIFQKSFNISIKHIWVLILYILLWFIIVFVTAIVTLGLAVLITVPLFYLSSAFVYRKLDADSSGVVEIPLAQTETEAE